VSQEIRIELEHEGAGHIVAALGDAIGPCAFSSLAATREWLATDMAAVPASAPLADRDAGGEVARVGPGFFPDAPLTATIATSAARN
jgi:NitT/TauT family transport system substrate-binding protein